MIFKLCHFFIIKNNISTWAVNHNIAEMEHFWKYNPLMVVTYHFHSWLWQKLNMEKIPFITPLHCVWSEHIVRMYRMSHMDYLNSAYYDLIVIFEVNQFSFTFIV